MARSLQVQHEERASTSPLLTGLLVFAALWLLVGAVLGAGTSDEAIMPPSDSVTR